MQRFLRSKVKRTSLYLDADGKCAYCGIKVGNDYHVDHIKPFVLGGKTELNNLAISCPACNLKKGSFFKEEKMNDNFFAIDFPNASVEDTNCVRECQREAYNAIIKKICIDKELTCSIMLPTGTGKSDVIKMLAIGLKNIRKTHAGVWVFSPTSALRDQIAVAHKEVIFYERIGVQLDKTTSLKRDEIQSDSFQGEIDLESFTIQFLTNSIDKVEEENTFKNFKKQLKVVFERTGKKPIVIFDEAHLCSDRNTWGEAAKKFIKENIQVVMFTGTPFRSDQMKIPGFNFEQIENTRQLKPDYSYKYKIAQDKGYILCPQVKTATGVLQITKKYQISDEIQIEDIDNDSRWLRCALNNRELITHFCKETLCKLEEAKQICKYAAAMITTIADSNPSEKNVHANLIESELKRQNPAIKTLIVTSNDEDNDNKKLLSFKNDTKYDILIVKNMATIGYDCPRIKVVVNMSNIRTLPTFIQLINRGCRKYKDFQRFWFIHPGDKKSLELIRKFKEEIGSNIIDVEESEKNINNILPINKTNEIIDIKLKDLSFQEEELEIKQKWLERLELLTPKTLQMIPSEEIHNLYNWLFCKNNTKPQDNSDHNKIKEIPDINQEIQNERDFINDQARLIAGEIKEIACDEKENGLIYGTIYKKLYHKVGAGNATKIATCKDINKLKKMSCVIENMRDMVFSLPKKKTTNFYLNSLN